MNILEIINKKANKQELTYEEIKFFVDGYTNGELPDYQISSLLMAYKLNDATSEEIYNLTKSYIESGDSIDFNMDFVVDKHSTGGIGDKTSLVLFPLLASLGMNVAKLSGRGLGFTGGTVDKLESIEGFSTALPEEIFIKNVKEKGMALIGQIDNLTPADKVLYSLRDVTGTVASMPLITASIMSKKLANGAGLIMLDVKCGEGAFMKNIEEARQLSKLMTDVAEKFNRKAICVITNMDEPLGNQVGNANEVMEAVETLKGNGPEDVTELCSYFASFALSQKEGISEKDARKKVDEVIKNGKAYEKFIEWIKLQGGKTDKIENNTLFSPKNTYDVVAKEEGFIEIVNSSEIGMLALLLGGGRVNKTDVIDHQVGIKVMKKQADKVKKGDLIATIYSNKPEEGKNMEKYLFEKAMKIVDKKPTKQPLILDTIK